MISYPGIGIGISICIHQIHRIGDTSVISKRLVINTFCAFAGNTKYKPVVLKVEHVVNCNHKHSEKILTIKGFKK